MHRVYVECKLYRKVELAQVKSPCSLPFLGGKVGDVSIARISKCLGPHQQHQKSWRAIKPTLQTKRLAQCRFTTDPTYQLVS
jgi:hypothetical protein